ncbi:hypothetical protein JKP88DRAFT_350675 [Tribonema minus]|uniref:Uncharacterized protein n=1 Tax=Tribonema minus TaxID=303371 RepID=A0A835YLS2_9STRA|nr:hypothetical protein JKP88DRAFT_350675 [Tribonema minus]
MHNGTDTEDDLVELLNEFGTIRLDTDLQSGLLDPHRLLSFVSSYRRQASYGASDSASDADEGDSSGTDTDEEANSDERFRELEDVVRKSAAFVNASTASDSSSGPVQACRQRFSGFAAAPATAAVPACCADAAVAAHALFKNCSGTITRRCCGSGISARKRPGAAASAADAAQAQQRRQQSPRRRQPPPYEEQPWLRAHDGAADDGAADNDAQSDAYLASPRLAFGAELSVSGSGRGEAGPSYAMPTKNFMSKVGRDPGSGWRAGEGSVTAGADLERLQQHDRERRVCLEENRKAKLRLEGQRRTIRELEHVVATLRQELAEAKADGAAAAKRPAAAPCALCRGGAAQRAAAPAAAAAEERAITAALRKSAAAAEAEAERQAATARAAEAERQVTEARATEARRREASAVLKRSLRAAQERAEAAEAHATGLAAAVAQAKRAAAEQRKEARAAARLARRWAARAAELEAEAGGARAAAADASLRAGGAEAERDACMLRLAALQRQVSRLEGELASAAAATHLRHADDIASRALRSWKLESAAARIARRPTPAPPPPPPPAVHVANRDPSNASVSEGAAVGDGGDSIASAALSDRYHKLQSLYKRVYRR